MDNARILIDRPETKDGYEAISVASFPCTNEYATSPAASTVRIEMADGISVVKNAGVTVLDVVKACIKKWSSAPPEWIAEDVAETISSWMPMDTEKVRWKDTLFDHCFYEGMQSATAINSKVVSLIPHGFGS
jgi:hypothetical protein